MSDTAQADTLAFLASGKPFGCAAPRRIDTHAAIIFLAGDRAWKIKRAVRFPYLDFSTADRRRDALEAELRLNRRTAPALYRAVHAISRGDDGGLALDGPGEAIDWLLEMVRFPDEALLAAVAARGALDDALAMCLAERIAAFHADAKRARAADGATSVRAIVEGNRASMARYPAILPAAQADDLLRRTLAVVADQAALLGDRARAGRVRHCHGDLHLANIVLLGGEPTLFDCLEFDPALATTDVLYDLAFLLMDLWAVGLQRQANIVFNRYLDISPDDEAGAALVAPFMSIRAAVRAHVHAAQARADDDEAASRARAYLTLAADLVTPVPARLVAIGGLSGTGKSTLARALGGALGAAPGARIVRSDVFRKRLAHVAPEVRLPPEAYTREASQAVYDHLLEEARVMLRAGRSAIVDAAFSARDERDAIGALAQSERVAFDGLWLEAATDVRTDRIGQRRADASDADAEVARRQRAIPADELSDWHRLDAATPPDAIAARAQEILAR